MIIATAGHIDHGKTSLVKALTGVDTDRTEEEKRRGMSIDLGFAHTRFGDSDEPIGFVDVPGHERFVRNMLAGVAAIDMALLVIAADDGPMPQTHEHLAVLDLLGVTRCAVALTKIDRVDADRLAEVTADVQRLLAAHDRHNAPVFPVSVVEGRGLAELAEHLKQAQTDLARRASEGAFRLVVDRSFIVPGAGLVVAGAVVAGECRVGDLLLAQPQQVEVRVRGIRSHDRPIEVATTGRRCALNLSGLDLKRHPIERGDWITAQPSLAPTARVDVRLQALPSADKGIGDGANVRLHIGAAERQARVALLSQRRLAPGETGWAQLILTAPVHALHGDRFVVRDAAAQRVVGGGVVVDPVGVVRGRARAQRLAELDAQAHDEVASALSALLALQADGIDVRGFAARRGLDVRAADALVAKLALHRYAADDGVEHVVTESTWRSARQRLLDALRDWHQANPASIGPGGAELAQAAGWRASAPLYRALLRSLLDERQIARVGFRWQLSGHRPRLDDADEALLQRILARLQASGGRPPIVGELAADLAMPQAELVPFLQRVTAQGRLVRVARNRWFLPETIERLTDIARELCSASPDRKFDAATYRDASGLGRNLTIELLEFFDRSQVTRFDGKRRAMAATVAAARDG